MKRLTCAAILWLTLLACDRDPLEPPAGTLPASFDLLPGWLVEPQIDISQYHGCAIATDQRVICWGEDGHDEATPPAGTFLQVDVNNNYSCGLRTDGSIACWGDGSNGRTSPPSGTFTQIAVGGDHGCALASSGMVNCWGNNADGRATPPVGTFVQITALDARSCGLRSDGTIACWGGSNQIVGGPGPTLAAGLPGVYTAIVVGAGHLCAIRPDQTVACTGYNGQGQTNAPQGTFRSIAAGFFSTCGIRTDGLPVCWGEVDPMPATVAAAQSIGMSGWRFTACALDNSGLVACWGHHTWRFNLEGNATGGPYFGVEGQPLTMQAVGDYTSFQWTLGDGTTGNAASVVHAYVDDGTYDVELTYGAGPTTVARTTAYIENAAPEIASVTAARAVVLGSPIRLRVSFADAGVSDSPWTIRVLDQFCPLEWAVADVTAQGTIEAEFNVLRPECDWWWQSYWQVELYIEISDKDGGRAVAFQSLPIQPSNTEVGTDVVVVPTDPTTGEPSPVSLSFSNVTGAGSTTVTSGTVGGGSGPPPPSGFRLGSPNYYFDIITTATFSGSVTVCIDYTGTTFGNESQLKLLHGDGSGSWTDVTTSHNTDNNVICGAVASLSPFLVAEENAAPTVTAIGLPANPLAINTGATVSASFTDANPADTHTATIDWGAGAAPGAAAVSEENGMGSASGSNAYAQPGVYTVQVTVNDGELSGSRSSTADNPAYIVVFDPSGGFVTGSGWINSPAGSYQADPLAAGKATFGFVSKYVKGATAPTGNTEFQFQAGSLTFKSSSYDWLVVNQGGTNAQFMGSGTVNGTAGYRFMLWATDGTTDRFRIRIWLEDLAGNETAVYDNGTAQPLGGGSVVVHTKN